MLAVVVVSVSYSDLNQEAKFYFLQLSLYVGIAVLVIVTALTCWKPEHLLYGAETHFEKWKHESGSDRGPSDLSQPQENPEGE